MNPLDLAILCIVTFSALFGLAVGFIRGVLFVAAVIGALAITRYSYNFVYGMVDNSAHNPLLSGLAAILGTFLVSLIVLVILTGQIAKLARSAGLSAIDRTIGFLFSGLCACAFLSFAFLLLEIGLPKNEWPAWIRDAKSTPLLSTGAEYLRMTLPESMRAKATGALDDGRQLYNQAAEQALRAYQNPAAISPFAAPAPASPAPVAQPAPVQAPPAMPAQQYDKQGLKQKLDNIR